MIAVVAHIHCFMVNMSGHWSDYTNFAISLFALLNPFTKIPYVLANANKNQSAVRIFAIGSTATIIAVLAVSHFIGVAALQVLGTSLPSFQIGGGIVVLLTGVHMLFGPGGEKKVEPTAPTAGGGDYLGLAVSPLGIPMLAGPGTITKVIIDTHPGTGVDNDLHSLVLISLCAIASGAVLAASSVLMRVLGNGFFVIMGRIAGLIIVAVAVEMIAKGISAHVHLFMG